MKYILLWPNKVCSLCPLPGKPQDTLVRKPRQPRMAPHFPNLSDHNTFEHPNNILGDILSLCTSLFSCPETKFYFWWGRKERESLPTMQMSLYLGKKVPTCKYLV